MRIINNIEYPVVDSKGGNCYKNQNYKIFWHLFYQMENLANIYPFLSQMEHRYFLLKNTEFLNVSWALILLNLLTQKSLNSNKLLLVLYFTNYYNCETFMTKIFGTKFLSFKFDIENEIFFTCLKKKKVYIRIACLAIIILLIYFFSIYFPRGSF